MWGKFRAIVCLFVFVCVPPFGCLAAKKDDQKHYRFNGTISIQ